MYQTILLIVCLAVVAYMALGVYRSATYPSQERHMSYRPYHYKYWIYRYQRHPYHAVSCEGNCEALHSLGGRRFLVSEAPPLPVPGCNAEFCDCKYVHHRDRRQGDRRLLRDLSRMLSDRPNRRRSRGRREDDGFII